MGVQKVEFELLDGQLGGIPVSSASQVCYVGSCSAAIATNTLVPIGDKNALETLGFGPVAECCAHNLAIAGGPSFAVKAAQTAGTATAPSLDGSNPLMTITGSPVDAQELQVRILTGGAIGVATFQYTLDGWRTESNPRFVAASFPVPGTGLTLGFPVGTYVANKVYVFTVTAPTHTLQNIVDATQAAINDMQNFGLLYVCGSTGGIDDAAKATNCATLVAALNAVAEAAFVVGKKNIRITVEAPDVADAALIQAFQSVIADRCSLIRIPAEVTSDLVPRVAKTEGGRIVVARLPRLPLGKDPSQAKKEGMWSGALPSQIRKLLRNESSTPGLDGARIVTATTYPGKTGFYVTNYPLLSEQPGSDFKWLQHGLIVDVLVNGIRSALVDWLSRDLDVRNDGSGGLDEGQASVIDLDINKAAKRAVGRAVVDLQFRVSRTTDVENEGLEGDLSLLRKAYPKNIKVRVGYTKQIIREEA